MVFRAPCRQAWQANSPPVCRTGGLSNGMRFGSELGRQVAVDFEPDADFHDCGSCPVHSRLPISSQRCSITRPSSRSTVVVTVRRNVVGPCHRRRAAPNLPRLLASPRAALIRPNCDGRHCFLPVFPLEASQTRHIMGIMDIYEVELCRRSRWEQQDARFVAAGDADEAAYKVTGKYLHSEGERRKVRLRVRRLGNGSPPPKLFYAA